MAIIVEDEPRARGGIGTLAVGGLGIILLAVAAYYIFFRRPELVEVATPANFRDTVQLSQITLSPEEVVNNPAFRSLQSHAAPLTPSTGGRANPFLATF